MDASLVAHNHAETIQKLERLNQLETITAEQRIRIEKYRTMYETLKAESEQQEENKHKRLNEIQMMKTEMNTLQTRYQELVSQARSERDLKIDECEELRMKVLTPQKMEVMKIRLQEEVELPYKQKLEALEAEVDKYRNEFNRLRYDYSFLKSEYEHELTQKKTYTNEIYGKFEIEKEFLQKQVKSLTEELNANKNDSDSHKLRMAQRENTQLNLRIKSLHTELEELREKEESNNLQTDQASRLQARQLSEVSMRCKSLEAEKETIKIQLDRVQKELDSSVREQDTLSNDLQRVERENLQLKSQLEEVTHSSKMELNNIKLNLMKERSDLEQERDGLRMEVNLLKNKNTVHEANIQQLKKNIEEKEMEVMKRIQAVKEEEWGRTNKLENAKAQLESQISSMEQQKLDFESNFRLQLEQATERLKSERDTNGKLERELSNTKNNLQQEKQRVKNLEQDITDLMEVKQKYQKLLQNYDSVVSSEQEIKNDADKMLNTIEILRKELEIAQEDLHNQREAHQKNVLEFRKTHAEDKQTVLRKYTDLQNEHKELKSKYDKITQAAKKKTKKLKSQLALANEEVKLLHSKQDQIALEKQALLKNMNVEQERMKRRFDKYRHRQHQFSQVLNASNFSLNLTDLSPIKRNSTFMLADDFVGDPPKSSVEPLGDAFLPQHNFDENTPVNF